MNAEIYYIHYLKSNFIINQKNDKIYSNPQTPGGAKRPPGTVDQDMLLINILFKFVKSPL